MNREYRVWITYLIKNGDDEEFHVYVFVSECDDINIVYSNAINKFINKIIGECVIIKSVEVDDVTKRDSVYN